MDLKVLLTVFGTILLTELGDKTQLATLLYATDSKNPKITVFIASASALIFSCAMNVFLGSTISKWVDPRYLAQIAGFGFIAIGIWTILQR